MKTTMKKLQLLNFTFFKGFWKVSFRFYEQNFDFLFL